MIATGFVVSLAPITVAPTVTLAHTKPTISLSAELFASAQPTNWTASLVQCPQMNSNNCEHPVSTTALEAGLGTHHLTIPAELDPGILCVCISDGVYTQMAPGLMIEMGKSVRKNIAIDYPWTSYQICLVPASAARYLSFCVCVAPLVSAQQLQPNVILSGRSTAVRVGGLDAIINSSTPIRVAFVPHLTPCPASQNQGALLNSDGSIIATAPVDGLSNFLDLCVSDGLVLALQPTTLHIGSHQEIASIAKLRDARLSNMSV
jgi:hypothetical protein